MRVATLLCWLDWVDQAGRWVRGSQLLASMLAHSAREAAALRAPSHEIRCRMISRLGHDKATRTTYKSKCTQHIQERCMQSWCRCNEFDGNGQLYVYCVLFPRQASCGNPWPKRRELHHTEMTMMMSTVTAKLQSWWRAIEQASFDHVNCHAGRRGEKMSGLR